MRIVRISPNGLEFIKHWEKFRSKPYKDSSGVPTIGFGSTYYPNGERVRLTDPEITLEQGLEIYHDNLLIYQIAVDSFTRDDINQNQFDALVSFAYNVGIQALKTSKLLRLINENPNDPEIAKQFLRWVYDEGRKVKGLINRRNAEINLYFS